MIPGSGRSAGEGIGYPLQLSVGFPGGSAGKESTHNAGDLGSIPGLGRSPGEGNGNPLQCSCLENPRDEGAWWAAIYGVAQSWTRLKRLSSSSSSNNRRELWGEKILSYTNKIMFDLTGEFAFKCKMDK